MNILGLVASERKLGNSEILAKEMLEALDGDKRLLRLSELRIETCHACYACLPSGKPCVIPDDLTFFLDQIRWADVIVLASPCYFLGAHTSIKQISDRLITVLNDGEQFRGKRCVVAVSYGVDDWEGYAREMAVNFARFLHLEVRGTLVARAANPGEVIRPDLLAQAHALARQLVEPSTAASPAATYTCADCGSSLLQIKPSGQVRCVMCGLTGQLSVENNSFSLMFQPGEHSRFSAPGMAEHGQRLESIKAEYIAKRKELLTLRKHYTQQDDWWVHPPR